MSPEDESVPRPGGSRELRGMLRRSRGRRAAGDQERPDEGRDGNDPDLDPDINPGHDHDDGDPDGELTDDDRADDRDGEGLDGEPDDDVYEMDDEDDEDVEPEDERGAGPAAGPAPEQDRPMLWPQLAFAGALLGCLLGWLWHRDDADCNDLSECMAPTVTALALTVVITVLLGLALRWLRVRPALLTTVVAAVIGLALLMVSGYLWQALAVPGSVPVWGWTLCGALALPLGHWVAAGLARHRYRRGAITALVLAAAVGVTWLLASDREGDLQLARLEAVGVDTVVLPQPAGFALSTFDAATAYQGAQEQPYLRWAFVPEGSSGSGVELGGGLVPLGGKDPCALAVVVEPDLAEGDCRMEGDDLVAASRDRQAAGQVRGNTLVLLTGQVDGASVSELQQAVSDATPATLAGLAELADH